MALMGIVFGHTLSILNALGRPKPVTRIIDGASLSFSLSRSWQFGHWMAFKTPTTRALSVTTST